MILMVIMTLAYGGATSYLANMEQCLKSLDFTHSTSITSFVVLSAMLSGIISSFFIVKKIKSTLQYKSIMCICNLSHWYRSTRNINYFYLAPVHSLKRAWKLGKYQYWNTRWSLHDSDNFYILSLFLISYLSTWWGISHWIFICICSNFRLFIGNGFCGFNKVVKWPAWWSWKMVCVHIYGSPCSVFFGSICWDIIYKKCSKQNKILESN